MVILTPLETHLHSGAIVVTRRRADLGRQAQHFARGPFHLVLVEILHQPQYLDELQNRIRDDPGNRILASCRAAANSYQKQCSQGF